MILIATPTRDNISAGCHTDLLKLCRRHPEHKFTNPLGIYIQKLRNEAVMMAISLGASHLLFIDSDMRFPETTVDRLLAAEKDIIAVNAVQRTMPIWGTARAGGFPCSSLGEHGLQPVESVGCGIMLIATPCFHKLKFPWFDMPYDPEVGTQIGEDVHFCREARNAGCELWIDHDLSQEVKHQGMVEYSVDSMKDMRDLVGA